MQLICLELENVKSYTAARVDFAPGTNAIVGTNGAGKSTILEAIGFALFDSLGYRQDDFVREGARTAIVTVTFLSSHDERRYQVVRRCGATNQHYIYDEELGSKLAEGKADVLTFLRRHTGVEEGADLTRLFSDAVGVPQGTLTAAFLQTPAQRKPIFDPLLQVEEYRKAYDRLSEPRRVLKECQQGLAVRLEGLRTRLERLPTLQEQALQVRTDLESADQELQRTVRGLQQAQQLRQALEEQRHQVETAHAQRDQAAQQATNLRERLADARQAAAQAEQARDLVARHRTGHAAYLAAQAEQQRLDAQRRARQELRDRYAQVDRELARQESQRELLERQLSEIAAATERLLFLAPLVERQQSLEADLQAARSEAATLAATQAELARHTAQRQRVRKRADLLQTQMARAEPLQQRRAEGQSALEALRLAIDGERDQLTRQRTEGKAVREQMSALQAVETALCPVCEQPLTPQHRQAMVMRNRSRLTVLEQEMAATAARLRAGEQRLKSLQEELEQVDEALRQLPRAAELAELRRQMDELAALCGQLEEHTAALDNSPQRVSALEQALRALGNPREEKSVASRTAGQRLSVAASLEQINAHLRALNAQLESLRAELDAFQTLEQTMAATAQALQSHEPAYRQVLSHSQLADSLPARSQEVARLTGVLAEAERTTAQAQADWEAAAAHFDPAAHGAAIAQEQKLSNRQGSLTAELQLRRRELERLQEEIADLLQRHLALQQAEEEQRALAEQEGLLEALRSVLRQAGPHVTRALVQRISHNAALLFGDIMQDYTRQLKWNEEYGISLEVEGRERSFAQLSGGEQMSAALAVRLALLREMSSIKVAFFDEPTTNLDESRRESLAQQILQIRGFRQLFVISHDDTFERATEHMIRVEKINGSSVVRISASV